MRLSPLRLQVGVVLTRISIEDQTNYLHKNTTFKLVSDLPWRTKWKGKITPFDTEYFVSITLYHSHRIKLKNGIIVTPPRNPRVIVEEPDLELSLRDSLDAHFYFNKENPRLSPLCLYHPIEDVQWSHDMLMSETLVPWIIQHLGAFEVWQDTGKWNLPEKHPDGGKYSEEALESDKKETGRIKSKKTLPKNHSLLLTASRTTIREVLFQYEQSHTN